MDSEKSLFSVDEKHMRFMKAKTCVGHVAAHERWSFGGELLLRHAFTRVS